MNLSYYGHALPAIGLMLDRKIRETLQTMKEEMNAAPGNRGAVSTIEAYVNALGYPHHR